MEILRCEGICKVYGSGENQVTALDGIDLSVEAGEFVSIVGHPVQGSPRCCIFLAVWTGLPRVRSW